KALAVDLVIGEKSIEQRSYQRAGHVSIRAQVSLAQLAAQVRLRILLRAMDGVAVVFPLSGLVASHIYAHQPRALTSADYLSTHGCFPPRFPPPLPTRVTWIFAGSICAKS